MHKVRQGRQGRPVSPSRLWISGHRPCTEGVQQPKGWIKAARIQRTQYSASRTFRARILRSDAERMTDRSSEALTRNDGEYLPSSPPPAGETPPPYPTDFGEGDGGAFDLSRLPSVIWRQKWLLMASVVMGLGVAYIAARSVQPRFTVQAMVQVGEPMAQQQGVTPIQTGPRFGPLSWANLMRSNAVLERVVDQERLFLMPTPPTTRAPFERAERVGEIVPGRYRVVIAPGGDRVRLFRGEDEILEEQAIVAASASIALPEDEVGDEGSERGSDPPEEEGGPSAQDDSGEVPAQPNSGSAFGSTVGIHLNLAEADLRPGSELAFELRRNRDAARWLAGNLQVQPSASAFMTVMMQGNDPHFAARVVNRVLDSFLEEALEVARAQSDQLSRTLEDQLASARQALEAAEASFEAFESENVLLPSAGPGGGSEVSSEFLELRLRREEVERELGALDRALAQLNASGEVDVQALEAIPAVRASSEIATALERLTELRAEARVLLLRYTEDHPSVQEVREDIRDLERSTLPGLLARARSLLAEESSDLASRASGRADDLRQVPTRALTQARLRRQLGQAEALYDDVNRRYSAARLAALSATPDVQVVDYAEPPSRPDGDRRLTLALGILFSFTGAGGVGAILLDRRDRRIRSPSDVETRLGLTILGALPHLSMRRGQVDAKDREQAVEAFRTIRLGLLYAYGSAGPTMLTVSSPAPGDGKSFVTSNLALSFAELGRKTVVIDGDTRKGVQHRLLGVDRRPGLTDYLIGSSALDEVIRPTSHPNLFVIPLGSLAQGSPELLVGAPMQELLAHLKGEFDVVLVDSPPLGAAADPIMLGSLTGSMVLVLRNAATDSDHAAAMLQNLRRYPVRLMGAVLNDVPSGGEYRYYGYARGYGVDEEEAEIGVDEGRQLLGAGRG